MPFRGAGARVARVATIVGVTCLAGPVLAWVYPEHRDIAVEAVEGLDPERRAEFDRLWQDARAGDEQRLCANGADATQGLAPPCIDWAALSGIAGDHACSSAQMLGTVRSSEWILVVADIAAQLKADLAAIPSTEPLPQPAGVPVDLGVAKRRLADEANRARMLNALRTADTRLQRADALYATRADSNNAHFMLARPDTSLDPYLQGERAINAGAEVNAIGVYAWYHTSALHKASRLAKETLAPEERRALARAMLFDEAFALHFLEDVYAAGHVAGSWGDVSQRKGTHDFYNENGLEVFTWERGSSTTILMGDAHMRPQDLALAGKAARTSLEQVLDAAAGRSRGYDVPYMAGAPSGPDDFDVCESTTIPDRPQGLRSEGRYRPALAEIIGPTPVPGLTAGLGAIPRFRSEVGPFIGVSSALDIRGIDGGFESSQTNGGGIAGLDLSLRVGVGLEGALSDGADGLVFVQAGIHADTNSTNQFYGPSDGSNTGDLTSAIPSEWGRSLRIRMPYYLIPGDLLLLSPMYFFNREAYTRIAVTAVNGGLLHWQQAVSARPGRFQFVLGREFRVAVYGVGHHAEMLLPGHSADAPLLLARYESTGYEVPIVEYRPYRDYSFDQSSSFIVQLFARADVIDELKVESPVGAPAPDLRTVNSIGVRMVFTWRHYW